MEYTKVIEDCWSDRSLLTDSATLETIKKVIAELDGGRLRVAEPGGDGGKWIVNEWIKKAI